METLEARRVTSAEPGGSSWPVLVDTDAGPRFTKLRGAGQGAGPLIAEIIVAALAEAIGLRVPRRCLVSIEQGIESANGRDELRDLLDASVGLNLGFDYLDGATMLRPSEVDDVGTDDAAAIAWLDALVVNPDRTPRNPNLLWWRGELWLIDHGAALGFQYSWGDVTESTPGSRFIIREPHVLRTRVQDMNAWDDILAARLTRDTIEDAVAQVPDDFLRAPGVVPERRRAAYSAFLWKRLKTPRTFFADMLATPVVQARGRPAWLSRPAG